MACEIKDIKDPTLKRLVSTYGEEGIKTYLNLTFNVLNKFDRTSPLTKVDAVYMVKSLDEYSSSIGENHFYTLNGVAVNSNDILQSKQNSFDLKLNIDFGEKYTSQKYQYTKENIPSEDNVEEGLPDDTDNEDPAESDVDLIIDDDLIDYIPESEIEDNIDDTIGEEFVSGDNDEEYDGELNYIEENILDEEDLFTFEGENDPSILYEDDFSQAFFKDSPLEVNLKMGLSFVIDRIKKRNTELSRLIGKVENRIKEIESQINLLGKTDVNMDELAILIQKKEHHEKNLIIMQTKLSTLASKKNIANLDALYEKNAAWINSILNSKNPGAEELKAVGDAISMWQNLRNIFGGRMHLDKKTLDGVLSVQRKAFNADFDKLHSKVLPSFIKKVGKDMFGLEIPTSAVSRESDIGTVGANTLGLAHYSNKPIVNLLHKFITSANSKSDNEYFDAANRIKLLFAKLKDAGLNFKDILSTDENGNWDGGIISRFTKSYYTFRKTIDKDFVEKMNDIKYGNKKDSSAKMLKEVRRKSDALKNNVYTINTKLLSTEHGLNKLLSELNAITHDEKYSRQLIEEAKVKQQSWTELYDHIEEREKELVASGKSEAESESFLNEYRKNTSPSEYYNYIYNDIASEDDIRMFGDIDKHIVEVPIRNNSNGKDLLSYDDRFVNKILSNPKMLEFYYAHASELAKYASYLPGYASKDIDGTFVPNVRREMMNKLLKGSLRGIPTTLSGRLMSAVTSRNGMQLEFLDGDGNPKNVIPMQYLRNLDVAEKSDNLEGNLVEFAKMAIAYKHLSAIEDYALLIKSAIEDKSFGRIILKADGTIDVANTKKSNGGEDKLHNLRNLITHVINNNLYNKSTDKEGVSAKKIYDDNIKIISINDPKKAINILVDFNELTAKLGKEAAINKIFKKYPSLVTLETEKVAGTKILKLINDLEWAYDNGEISKEDYEYKKSVYKQFTDATGSNFVWSQAGDILITSAAMTTFAFNPFPAVTNIAFGQVNFMAHAAGRTEFTPKEALASSLRAISSLRKTAGGKNLANNKIYNIAMRNGILAENYGGDAGANKYSTKFFSAFGWLSEGDYILRTSVMDAMMHHTKMTDINGKERPLIDAFNNDGSWNAKEFGKNEDWGANSESILGNKELLSFMNKVKFVNQLLHGNMAKESSIMFKRSIIGRMVSQYRMSWLADGVYARFAPRQSLGVLGRDFEGTYRTMFNFIQREGLFSGVAQMGSVFAKLAMFKGESSFDGIKLLTKDKQLFMSNMRKQFVELKVMLMLATSYLLLSASLDDDDKETKRWKYLLMNNMNNTIKDITFFIDPTSFKTTTDNLIPALGFLDNYRRLMTTFYHHILGDPYYNDQKVKERFMRSFPIANVFYKFQDRTTGMPQAK
jgi:hypothetical protein